MGKKIKRRWKIRPEKLETVRADIENRHGQVQVSWQFAKKQIELALNKEGRQLSDGLNKDDFELLKKHGINGTEILFEKWKNHQHRRPIEDFPRCLGGVNLTDFLEDYLKIENYSQGTWKDFNQGKAISKESFDGICDFLGINPHEYGLDEDQDTYNQKFFTTLLSLDHDNQRNRFSSELNQNFHAAFAIHGSTSRQISIYWLTKSLIKQIKNPTDLSPFNLNTIDLDTALNKIYKNFKVSVKKNRIEKLAEKIANGFFAKGKDVIFVFIAHQNDEVAAKYLNTIVKDFWQPLKKAMEENYKQGWSHKLLLFWIEMDVNSQIEQYQDDLTLLPIVDEFNRCHICYWLKQELQNQHSLIYDIHKNLSSDCASLDAQIETIWSYSQGQPEVLLQKIYKFCYLEWDTYKHKWMTLNL